MDIINHNIFSESSSLIGSESFSHFNTAKQQTEPSLLKKKKCLLDSKTYSFVGKVVPLNELTSQPIENIKKSDKFSQQMLFN